VSFARKPGCVRRDFSEAILVLDQMVGRQNDQRFIGLALGFKHYAGGGDRGCGVSSNRLEQKLQLAGLARQSCEPRPSEHILAVGNNKTLVRLTFERATVR
jgi:hypothetical protein